MADPEPRTALILYGSETGNAQDIAEEIGRLTERLHFVTEVQEANNVVTPSALSSSSLVIFSVSTTGQGDLPSNSQVFWRSLLRKRLLPDSLSGVRFSVFGLGDSSYPKFNFAARKLNKRLVQLGASSVHTLGEADEQHEDGVDGTFIPWLSALRASLLSAYPLSANLSPLPDSAPLPPKWILRPFTSGVTDHRSPESRRLPASIPVILIQNRRLTPASHFQDVRHIIFSAPPFTAYCPGDALTIYPDNPSTAVSTLLTMQSWHAFADQLFLVPKSTPFPLLPSSHGSTTTLRNLLTCHLSILSVPRRSFFAALLPYADSAAEHERLGEFADPRNRDDLYDYTTRPRRTILEVLADFPSVRIPYEQVLNIFPPLRGRSFSIASGGPLTQFLSLASTLPLESAGGLDTSSAYYKANPPGSNNVRIDLLVAILTYRTILRNPRKGLCSHYLADLQPGTTIQATISRSATSLFPASTTSNKSTNGNSKTPLVLIGPGTGLAPLRAMIWERAMGVRHTDPPSGQNKPNGSKHTHKPPTDKGQIILIFGARDPASDFFFEAEWKYLKAFVPLKLVTAFSRADPKHRVYVQDRIVEAGVAQDIVDCLGLVKIEQGDTDENSDAVSKTEKGWVIICGRAGRMPKAVRGAIADAIGSVTGDNGNTAVERVEKEGRWRVEAW